MTQPKHTYKKHAPPIPDRQWTFEYRTEENPVDNMVRLIRFIFEGTFKGKALFDVLVFLFLFGIILSLIIWIFSL